MILVDAKEALKLIKEELDMHSTCEPQHEYCGFYSDIENIIETYESDNGS